MIEPWDKSPGSRMLWQRARAAGEAAGAAADGMPDALLLAAYAEDRLDAAERAEVEALLADDAVLAEDAAAARALAAAPPFASEAELARIIARASALVPDANAEGQVVPFRPRGGSRTGWAGAAARWSALAASVALVGYLGFALGNDASSRLSAASSTSAGIDALFDPPSGFFSASLDAGTT